MKTKIFLLFLILQFLNILILNNVYAKEDAVYWYNKGVDATGLNKKIEYYTKAIELNPKYATAYNNRGDVYYNKGEYDKAIKDWTKAIELNPEFATAYNNRALVYYNSVKGLEKDISVGNMTEEGIYRIKGLCDKSIQDYNKTIELNPKYSDDTRYNIEELNKIKGLCDKVIEAIEIERIRQEQLILVKTGICKYDPAFGTISGIDENGMNLCFICSKKQMNFARKNIGKKVIIKFLPLKYHRDMPMVYYRSYNGRIKSISIISSGTKKGSNIRLIELDKLPEINLENLPEDLQNFISKIREEDSMAVITGYSYNLNEDTEDEYIITYSWATAMAIFIFQNFDEKWQLIGEIDNAGIVKISSKKMKGYFDIYDMLRYPYGKYIWNGKKYVYKKL